MLAYTIAYKEKASDPLWDHIVYLKDEYPNMSFSEFGEMCREATNRLIATNEIVYGDVNKLIKVK